jgi:hypothetical protein
LPLDPTFAVSDPAKSDEYLREIKIRSTTSFGGEVKTSTPCHKVLRHVKEPLWYYADFDRQNSAVIFNSVLPCFPTRCLLKPQQITWVDESGIIRTEMGSTIDQKMDAVTWDALYNTTP